MLRTLSLIVLFLSPVAFADPDDDCRGDPHHCNGGSDTGDTIVDVLTGDTTVDTVVSRNSRVLSLGRSSFDTDINDCRESTAFDTPLFGRQGVRLNPWCAAEVYDAKGMHQMAALVRCDIKEIKKHFATSTECVKANTMTVQPLPPPPLPVAVEIDDDEEDDKHTDLLARVEQLEEKRQADARNASEARRQANAARQEQQEWEQEQRAYAAQAIADLKEYTE